MPLSMPIRPCARAGSHPQHASARRREGRKPTPSTDGHAAGLGMPAVQVDVCRVGGGVLSSGIASTWGSGACRHLTQQLARKGMGKEKDQFGDVAVSLARGRKESNVGRRAWAG